MPHDYRGALRRGCCFISVSMQFRRICHAPPAKGDIASRPWRGCHSSTASSRRHKLHIAHFRLSAKVNSFRCSGFSQRIYDSPGALVSCAAGFRLKSVDGREQVSLSPAQSSRPVCQTGSRTYVDRSASLSITSESWRSWRRVLCRWYAGFVLAIPCIQFSMYE